ncbi:DUF5666 domain-containing protein [Ramlibacter tataouinensis]|uniref:DUF5666 domain-containing protein n=1 Tax=Ramlibacter tataouinensis (strain ATCC BAA-407 / DSM 14655 / LMG 21543 / TTB310) TaxID=365046 RepID=F5Y1C8_RAMTT|nr:DUF5666 domain-containing protein [Ramlibacter tataouinensis]AEG94712.1 Conserved hypothetical protein [Ramlibacter tataouinensis TTB310]
MIARPPFRIGLMAAVLLLASCGGGGTGVAGGGGGVGSGGTGAMASNVTVGSVEGFASIIVNGIRYNVDAADTRQVEDPEGLKFGMTVRVQGMVDAGAATGTASSLASTPQVRGAVTSVDAAGASFVVLGLQVRVNAATVYEGLGGLGELVPPATVQVYGLPGEAGRLLATRVERVAPGATRVLTGAVQDLDRPARRFRLGGRLVDYRTATFDADLTPASLDNGTLVRVELPSNDGVGVLAALRVRPWYAVPLADGTALSLSGPVTDYAGPGAFKVQGVRVDASQARINGGPASALREGAYVDASGVSRSGVLVPERLRIRSGDDEDEDDDEENRGRGEDDEQDRTRFSAEGRISQFEGLQRFRVQGQWVDASGASVRFQGGSAADLARGRRVSVRGSAVRQGTLLADSVRFGGDD